jgi:hypothetical protein
VQVKDIIAKLVITSRSVYGSSIVDSTSVVGAIVDRAKACFWCGGRGHIARDCSTPGRPSSKKDDGTSKPDPNVGREWERRDDPDGSQPHRGTRRKKITDVTRTPIEFKWTKELGPCRHCGKNGHLNRDCDDPEAKIKEAGRKAVRAAKVAAGATPAYIYQMDVEFQLAADAEVKDVLGVGSTRIKIRQSSRHTDSRGRRDSSSRSGSRRRSSSTKRQVPQQPIRGGREEEETSRLKQQSRSSGDTTVLKSRRPPVGLTRGVIGGPR